MERRSRSIKRPGTETRGAGCAEQPWLGLLFNGKYEDAVRAYQQAAMTGSLQPKIHNNLGLAYAKLERYHDALDAFTKGSDQSQAYNNLGTIFLDSASRGMPRCALRRLWKLRRGTIRKRPIIWRSHNGLQTNNHPLRNPSLNRAPDSPGWANAKALKTILYFL
jgi:Tetratricopeptide repeat.